MRQARGKLICPVCGTVMVYSGEELVEIKEVMADGEFGVEEHSWRVFECECGSVVHLRVPTWRTEKLEEIMKMGSEEVEQAC